MAAALGMALAIAGCTLDFGAAAGPATLDRAEAQAYLAALQVAQRDALDLWARLIAGEAISCEQAITLPPPLTEHAGTTRAQEVLDQLSEARAALEQSAARWDLECASASEVVGLAAARVGQDAARRATEPLQAAQTLLATWAEADTAPDGA